MSASITSKPSRISLSAESRNLAEKGEEFKPLGDVSRSEPLAVARSRLRPKSKPRLKPMTSTNATSTSTRSNPDINAEIGRASCRERVWIGWVGGGQEQE